MVTGGNCQIQYAALKENNYEYPKTLEEYEALIKQYLAAHPKTDDGLDTIGISMSAADWHWLITLSNPLDLLLMVHRITVPGLLMITITAFTSM